MSDFWYFVVGIIAAVHGVNALEHARAGHHFRPWPVLGAFLAGYMSYGHCGRLWVAGGALRLVGLALLFGAAAPVLGYVLYGQNGRIRRLLMKTVAFLVLLVIVSSLWLRRLEPHQALMTGILVALLPFLPWSGIGSRLRSSRQGKMERRQQKLQAKAQTREERRRGNDRGEVRELHRLATRASRTLQVQQQRLASLERGEHRERARLDALREEVMEQVRLVRQAEVERIRAGNDGHRQELHSHYGFLIAEGNRTLRAEIASGQRSAASEHDAFFFQVIKELLEAPDFERRYLHEMPGRAAVAAVNRYLRGHLSYAALLAELEALEWQPELLAPIPLRGELVPALLEAWLVPHRRQQKLEWQLFCAGDHPRQGQLNEFFDGIEIELPTREEWRELWDENPAVFVKS